MIFDSEEFGFFEKCPRLPGLQRVYAPPRLPIRDAVKQFFKSGIRGIMAGEEPDGTVQGFIQQAAVPGYVYPKEGEHYILAQDHAYWLEGALRLVKEEFSGLVQLPLYPVENHNLHIEAWQAQDRSIHLFRVKNNLGDRAVYWPELCLMALAGEELELIEQDIHIHVYRLPGVRNGRILSPLNMAYRHPTFVNVRYRLARLYDDDEFSKSWIKTGRWEIQPAVSWEEWRRGIDNDKAIPLIRESFSLSPKLDPEQRRKLKYDIQQMCVAMERPSMYPRFREKCQSCIMSGICHGDEASRSEYELVGEDELERYAQRLVQNIT